MPAAQGNEDGSEETTIPAIPHADTVPVQVPESLEPATMRQLAHRRAPEPVIVEPTEPADPHEPPTNEIPRLGRLARLEPAAARATARGGHEGRRHEQAGAEPPTTRWRPPGRGQR